MGLFSIFLVGSENRVAAEIIAGWLAGAARLRPAGFGAAAFATKWLAQPKLAQPAKAGGPGSGHIRQLFLKDFVVLSRG